MVKAIGAFDIKENLSEEERKAREIKKIADNMVFEEGWLDEAPYPLLNTSEAKKTTSNFLNNKEIKKLKKQDIFLAHPTNPVECCADANPKTMLPNDT